MKEKIMKYGVPCKGVCVKSTAGVLMMANLRCLI